MENKNINLLLIPFSNKVRAIIYGDLEKKLSLDLRSELTDKLYFDNTFILDIELNDIFEMEILHLNEYNE
jgi:ribosomal protein L25 (general stress protein Ctc)